MSTASAVSTLVPIGVIVGAHGVRGELRVKLLNPASELLAKRRTAWLRQDATTAPREVALRGVRVQQPGLLLLSIDDCDDRDVAQALRGTELCVPRAELPALEPGEHYLVDLIGLAVKLEDGTPVGVVEQTIEYPSAQVLRVRVASGVVEVPMFEPYLVSIAPDRGAVVVRHMDDLDVQPDPR